MIFYYIFYQVRHDIASSSSPLIYFHSKNPGDEFPLTGCPDEIVRLVHHLPHLSFPEKNRDVNVKNEFLMTYDIIVYYMHLIDFEFHPYM